MKLLIFIFAIIAAPTVLFAQGLPLGFKAKQTRPPSDSVKVMEQQFLIFENALNKVDIPETNKKQLRNSLKQVKKVADSEDQKAKTKTIDTSRFVFYGTASLASGSDLLSSITSTGNLYFIGNPVGDWHFSLGANLLYANPGTTKKDSVDLVSLMFPETGHFGLLAALSYEIILSKGDNEHTLTPEIQFAYRKVSIDSPAIGFKVLNYNLGVRYQWNYTSQNANKDQGTLSFMPYLHYMRIANTDVNNFKSFVGDSVFSASPNKKAGIFSWGAKATLQYKSLILFADVRKSFTTTGFAPSDPLSGLTFNIGLMSSFKLLSF